jgi:hypothetical protein
MYTFPPHVVIEELDKSLSLLVLPDLVSIGGNSRLRIGNTRVEPCIQGCGKA